MTYARKSRFRQIRHWFRRIRKRGQFPDSAVSSRTSAQTEDFHVFWFEHPPFRRISELFRTFQSEKAFSLNRCISLPPGPFWLANKYVKLQTILRTFLQSERQQRPEQWIKMQNKKLGVRTNC